MAFPNEVDHIGVALGYVLFFIVNHLHQIIESFDF